MLLESFISTQKLSVQKTLQRKFKRFVSHQRDFQELLLSVLQGLVREQLRYEAMNGAAPAADAFVSVPIGCALATPPVFTAHRWLPQAAIETCATHIIRRQHTGVA